MAADTAPLIAAGPAPPRLGAGGGPRRGGAGAVPRRGLGRGSPRRGYGAAAGWRRTPRLRASRLVPGGAYTGAALTSQVMARRDASVPSCHVSAVHGMEVTRGDRGRGVSLRPESCLRVVCLGLSPSLERRVPMMGMVARAGPPCRSFVTLRAGRARWLGEPWRGWLMRAGRTCSPLQTRQMQLPLQAQVKKNPNKQTLF